MKEGEGRIITVGKLIARCVTGNNGDAVDAACMILPELRVHQYYGINSVPYM